MVVCEIYLKTNHPEVPQVGSTRQAVERISSFLCH